MVDHTDFLVDDFKMPWKFRILRRYVALNIVGSVAHGSEWVANLMGDTGRHLPDGCQLRLAYKFRSEFLQLVFRKLGLTMLTITQFSRPVLAQTFQSIRIRLQFDPCSRGGQGQSADCDQCQSNHR